MSFSSYGFILCFLPLSLIGYYSLRRYSESAGKLVLLIASVVFLSIQGVYHALIAIASLLINFFVCRLMTRARREKQRKAYLIAGIAVNIITLAVFKYAPAYGFAWSLPFGISFYTFQQIAYLVECYRNPKAAVLPDYALFVLFFPKMAQGPIPYPHELIPSIAESVKKPFSSDNLAKGIFLFTMGLAKKILIADTFGIIADYGYADIASLNSFEALLTIFAYTFQLYFDFSGYSDMAIAVGCLFGIDLPLNFNSPYKAKNISDFWKRWHITLTRFLTKYIYIPLGGNRKGAVRTYINILAVYLVSGLWHGTGNQFLIWGLMHGLASVLYRIFKKQYDRLPSVLQWAMTFIFINVSWVFFRAENASSAVLLLRQVFTGGWSFHINAALTEALLQPTFINIFSQILPLHIVIALCFAAVLLAVTLCKNTNERMETFRPCAASLLKTYLLLIISLLSLSGVSGFLYTNF